MLKPFDSAQTAFILPVNIGENVIFTPLSGSQHDCMRKLCWTGGWMCVAGAFCRYDTFFLEAHKKGNHTVAHTPILHPAAAHRGAQIERGKVLTAAHTISIGFDSFPELHQAIA
jgi:hypothetical protein